MIVQSDVSLARNIHQLAPDTPAPAPLDDASALLTNRRVSFEGDASHGESGGCLLNTPRMNLTPEKRCEITDKD
ncbi:unnamed protein product [Danaus chrysippus]|uniref:(African queen) hypothetical protein n=1 Tax=Danaus chrysippus TaxID=151541 RepID=A0A8J2QH39_9NEOP|nr:unnamed protein product [Danaus chrysippus]